MLYKLCKTEQSAKRQRQLEQGLLEMMCSARFDDIMISDLCEKLQVPRKSFYRYFSGKEGALHALIDHTMMEYEAFSREKQKGKERCLQLELEIFFEFWLSQKTFLDALQKSGLSTILMERVFIYVNSEGVFPVRFMPGDDDQSRRHILTFAVCGMFSMVLMWHHRKFKESVVNMARLAKRMLDQPLFPDADALMR